jgi:hypothetical protein
MLLDQLSDKRKTSTSKLFIIGIILAAVLIAVGAAGFFFKPSDSIKITKQENFYGISGIILEVRDNSIIIETSAIPYNGSSPSQDDRWVWTVSIDGSTEITALVPDNNARETIDGGGHVERPAAINDLKAGDNIIVTSRVDIEKQFQFDEKHIIASNIKVAK